VALPRGLPLPGKQISPTAFVWQAHPGRQAEAEACQRGAASIAQSLPPGEPAFIPEKLILRVCDSNGTEFAQVRVDETECGLLQKAAAASGLSLCKLLSFIIYRQLEAFFPRDARGVWRVSPDTVNEITETLAAAALKSESLWATARALTSQLAAVEDLKSPAGYLVAASELKGLAIAIEYLSSAVRCELADGKNWWDTSIRPALFEKQPLAVGDNGRSA